MKTNLTKTQLTRLMELEDIFNSYYMEDGEFDIYQWLKGEDLVNYCKLYRLDNDYEQCFCDTHK